LKEKGIKGAYISIEFTKFCVIYHSKRLHYYILRNLEFSSNSSNTGFVEATEDNDPLELGLLKLIMVVNFPKVSLRISEFSRVFSLFVESSIDNAFEGTIQLTNNNGLSCFGIYDLRK
jgi:hypothetical protein